MSENKIYTVNVGGHPVKSFNSKAEANKFVIAFTITQHLHVQQLDMIDEAVLKSDMCESKELLKYIMEKK